MPFGDWKPGAFSSSPLAVIADAVIAALCFGLVLLVPILGGVVLSMRIGGWAALPAALWFVIIGPLIALQHESWELGERPFMFCPKYEEYRDRETN